MKTLLMALVVVCGLFIHGQEGEKKKTEEPKGKTREGKRVVDIREYGEVCKSYVRLSIFRNLRKHKNEDKEVQIRLKENKMVRGKVLEIDVLKGTARLKLSDGGKVNLRYEEIDPKSYPNLIEARTGTVFFCMAISSMHEKDLKAAVQYLKEADQLGHKGAKAMLPKIEALLEKEAGK